tara:strand:+ start:73 stop:426 length:354 start_codon:yes stop_codon:yes gene_type:complete
MKRVGEILKNYRKDRGFTLRKFCQVADIDPSNWSKIERGLLEPPKSEEVLTAIGKVLELTTSQLQEVKDIAAVESIPKGYLDDEEVLNALPVFFRTTRELKPTKEELEELFKLLKNK